MALALETKGDRQLATFTGAFDIYTAAEAVAALRGLRVDQPLEVDTEGVESFDVAGLQVLAWLKARHPGTRFTATSRVVRETFDFLRLGEW